MGGGWIVSYVMGGCVGLVVEEDFKEGDGLSMWS
jgi:hypothetical protein